MLITVGREEFSYIMIEKARTLKTVTLYVHPLSDSLLGKWVSELDAVAFVLMHWVMRRTVFMGVEAAVISLRDIKNGYVMGPGFSFPALTFSINTIRKHLQILTDSDFLIAYCIGKRGEKEQQEARIYEINFKKVIDYDCARPENRQALLSIEQAISVEKRQLSHKKHEKSDEGVYQILEGGVSNTEHSYIYIHTDTSYLPNSHRLDKSNQLQSAVFDAPKDVVDFSVEEKVERIRGKYILKSISIPKKVRPSITRSDSIAEVLSTQKVKHTAVAATRVAQATAGKLTVQSLQALLDKLMRDYHPAAPRLIVTVKAFGVLRKRIEAVTVASVVELITFSIQEWETLAGQNRAAFLRSPQKAQRGTPLSSKPTFNEFAYRLPYFIAAYSQTVGTVGAPNAKSSSDERIAELKARLAESEKDNRSNREVIRRMARTKRVDRVEEEVSLPARRKAPARFATASAAVHRTPIPGSPDDWLEALEAWEPPKWESEGSGKAAGRVVKVVEVAEAPKVSKVIRRGINRGK